MKNWLLIYCGIGFEIIYFIDLFIENIYFYLSYGLDKLSLNMIIGCLNWAWQSFVDQNMHYGKVYLLLVIPYIISMIIALSFFVINQYKKE